jgi:hypothetical protein
MVASCSVTKIPSLEIKVGGVFPPELKGIWGAAMENRYLMYVGLRHPDGNPTQSSSVVRPRLVI